MAHDPIAYRLVAVREASYLHDILERDPAAQGFNVGVDRGPVAGQTVMHCHVHVMPRRKGDTRTLAGEFAASFRERLSASKALVGVL